MKSDMNLFSLTVTLFKGTQINTLNLCLALGHGGRRGWRSRNRSLRYSITVLHCIHTLPALSSKMSRLAAHKANLLHSLLSFATSMFVLALALVVAMLVLALHVVPRLVRFSLLLSLLLSFVAFVAFWVSFLPFISKLAALLYSVNIHGITVCSRNTTYTQRLQNMICIPR